MDPFETISISTEVKLLGNFMTLPIYLEFPFRRSEGSSYPVATTTWAKCCEGSDFLLLTHVVLVVQARQMALLPAVPPAGRYKLFGRGFTAH